MKLVEVIEQLKAAERFHSAKPSVVSTAYKNGFGVGREWAEKTAKPDELERLAGISFEALCNETTYCASDQVAFVVRPDCHGDSEGADDFWDSIGVKGWSPSPGYEPAFVLGFAEGAIEAYADAKV